MEFYQKGTWNFADCISINSSLLGFQFQIDVYWQALVLLLEKWESS